eukprot:55282-Rhodomonas_salina.1
MAKRRRKLFFHAHGEALIEEGQSADALLDILESIKAYALETERKRCESEMSSSERLVNIQRQILNHVTAAEAMLSG